MKYAEMKEYLDGIVIDFKNATEPRYLTNHIKTVACTDSKILVYEGMETIADVMGLEIKEKYVGGENLNYEYSFVYDGVKFVSFEEKRLERFAGTDRE